MSRGRFISLEGGEGTGKSTQGRMLVEALETLGVASLLTREPGGTPGAEAIRELLLAPPGEPWPMGAEAALFAAARADHLAHAIKPALAKGQWVVCDRFVDSSRAYQGGAGGLGDDAIMQMHELCSGGVLPDLTVLLTVDPDQIAQRLALRDQGQADAIGGRDLAFHQAVAKSFADLAEGAPDRFVQVDGNGSVQEVHQQIMQAIAPLLAAMGKQSSADLGKSG